MYAPSIFSNIVSFATRNERALGATLFAFGFVLDIFTFGLLPITTVNYIFIGYLTLAAVSIFGANTFAGLALRDGAPWWRRLLSALLPLSVQYAFGALLSGLFMFYTIHSFLVASWPFLFLLALIYVANEYFRMYKHYLVFQVSLFFFTLYAYAIFGLPLLVGSIGPWVFLGSTVTALLLFAGFFYLLSFTNRVQVKRELGRIRFVAVVIVVVIAGSYVSGLIPPLPLALAHAGVYHSLTRTSDGYLVESETPRPWWEIGAPTIHHAKGETLYVVSAVSAPVQFGTSVVHVWERYTKEKGWSADSKVSFPISGGREGGYRGYSYRTNLPEGKWRVSVETENGQTIGRIRFDVETVATPPVLIEERL